MILGGCGELPAEMRTKFVITIVYRVVVKIDLAGETKMRALIFDDRGIARWIDRNLRAPAFGHRRKKQRGGRRVLQETLRKQKLQVVATF